MEILFWILAGVVAYAYVGYPLVVWLLARCCGRRDDHPLLDEADLPSVSLLIAAHNEEDVIEERLENALALDYPRQKLQIVVASDGSKDATCEIVRRFEDRGVVLLDFNPNRGKSATLNRAIPKTSGDLVVFSDANTMYEADAIRRLVRWFDDEQLGAVCGRLILRDPVTSRNVDSLYWRYETFLKNCEGRLGGLLGANGAIYALRKSVYVPIPDATIVDDLVIPLLARLKSGCRLLYDPSAVACEDTPPVIRSEFKRRTRIGTGAYQCVPLLWRLLSPRFGWTSFCFFSHKLLRWLVPFCLIGMLALNLALLDQPLYRVVLGAQAAFYAIAALGLVVRGNGLPIRLMRVPTMFSGMNLALLVGFGKWLFTNPSGTWNRTTR